MNKKKQTSTDSKSETETESKSERSKPEREQGSEGKQESKEALDQTDRQREEKPREKRFLMAKSNPHQPWNTSCKENLRSKICSRDWGGRRSETVGSGTRKTRSLTRLLPIRSFELHKSSSLMGLFVFKRIIQRLPLTPTRMRL